MFRCIKSAGDREKLPRAISTDLEAPYTQNFTLLTAFIGTILLIIIVKLNNLLYVGSVRSLVHVTLFLEHFEFALPGFMLLNHTL